MSSPVDLATVLKRRVRALEVPLASALDGDPRALHRARVASRRIREVLPLLSTIRPKSRKRVRQLTHWLGRVREMDVALGLLADPDLGDGTSRATLGEARQHLQITRDKRREKLLRRLGKIEREKLDRTLRKLGRSIESEDANAWRRTLAARLARRVNALRRAVDRSGAIYVPERLHAVRIAAKKLRYALEIAAELGVRDAATSAAVVRRTQVTLGDLLDRHVLARHVLEAASQPEADETGLAALASSLEASCRQRHAAFLSQRDALSGALTGVRQLVIPALAHPARGRKPLRATTAAVTHGRSNRVVPDSARGRRGAGQRLA